MKTILITGATGFLGQHLVQRLRESEPNAKLRLLLRKPGAETGDTAVEHLKGDVTDPASVRAAAENCDEIYHLAGIVLRDPKDAWRLHDVHTQGTRHVCDAVLDAGVKRVVIVSSSGTIALGPDPTPRDETAPYALEIARRWPYYESKIYAEKLAFWYARERQAPIVVVNPSLLLGPGDERRSSTKDVELFLQEKIPAVPTGGLNLVDARDAAHGLVLAMQKGREGERYLLGGPNWTFKEWMQHVESISGVRAPRMQPSLKMSLLGARLLRKISPLWGGTFPMDDASIEMSSYFWYIDSSKARNELGFTTRDPKETLSDTIDYLRR